jgi:hypothetical protein
VILLFRQVLTFSNPSVAPPSGGSTSSQACRGSASQPGLHETF